MTVALRVVAPGDEPLPVLPTFEGTLDRLVGSHAAAVQIHRHACDDLARELEAAQELVGSLQLALGTAERDHAEAAADLAALRRSRAVVAQKET